MKTKPMLATSGLVATAAATPAAESKDVAEFITQIKSTDDHVRGPAWQGAGPLGAPAVKPLAEVMTHQDFEIARAAKRALWKIVRHAGRPGAESEARAVVAELVRLLSEGAVVVRREVLWMLSEIGGDEAVAPMAALLADAQLREDARGALLRIPGAKATAALRSAFGSAPEEFKFALADALRRRGEQEDGYPSRKLVPTRQTRMRR